MASGGRDIGTGRPARQGQMPTSYIGNQNAMRGIQQGMKQLQVSGQGGLSSESQSMQVDRQQQVATPWTITNLTPDKRLVKHARALQEIRDSLQNYEVGGDFDRADLDRCVELGFDEDISRDVLRANKDKDFGVALATLMSLTNMSGRKTVKSIAPGTLQNARIPTSAVNTNSSARGSQITQSQKIYGAPVPTSGSNVYIKSAAIPAARLENRSAFRRQAVDSSLKGQTGTGTDPFRVDRGQFLLGDRKAQETIMNNHPEVRLRQNRSNNRDSQKRWSADVLQKTNAFELPNKRNSLAFEVGDGWSQFDIPNKPPPPYPGFLQSNPQQDLRLDQWTGGAAKMLPTNGNVKRIASMETVAKIGTESPRLNSPVTTLTDNRRQFLNGSDMSIQEVQSQDMSAFQTVGINYHFAPRVPPPPYHELPHRPIQRTYSPSDRTNVTSRISTSTSVNHTVYSYTQGGESQLIAPDNLQQVFAPIRAEGITDSYYNGSQGDTPSNRASPPPYPGQEHRHTAKEKRFSYASDVDSGTSSKRASAIFADGSTQSDSSGSTSPAPETIESRCSPLPLTNSPYPTLVIHSSDSEAKSNEAVKEEPFNPRLKVCSSQAYKFFMEQHVENLLKLRQMREKRKKQLEIEMSRYGLSKESQTEMRKMLMQKESNHIRMKRSKMTRSMFSKVKILGMGAFGEVALVRKTDANALYAMKTLRKADVIRRNQVAHVKAERDILAEADNEWVVKLFYSFQDADNLYFVMEYVPGGDLMALLIKQGIFCEELGQFYTAELVLAVESVHKMGFIHRDIKPDNVLIDRNGHIKLTDFGLCTGFRWTHDSKYYQQDPNHARQPSMEPEGGWENILDNGQCDCGDVIKKFDLCKPLDRRAARQHMRCLAHSLVGTPNYIAPEVLLRIPYTQLCDWWSVGVILYEMLVGQPPFLAKSPAETQMKVVQWQNTLKIPHHAKLSPEAKDLIQKLCTGPENRIGGMSTDEIKKHPFFFDVDWINCLKNKPPPYIPKIKHPTDTSNFDPVPEKETDNDDDKANEEEKQRILDKAPQHAFYEFTFRRFFDEGGHPQAFCFEDDSRGGKQSLQSEMSYQSNKRSVTTSDKSVPIPNKVAAPPITQGKLDEKAPIYV